MVEGSDHGIAAGANQRGHEEGRADGGSSAPDQALAFEHAAIMSQRGDPNERGDLFARQGPELRQCANQRATEDRADAGHGAQQILLGAPHWTGLDGVIQIPIDIVQLALEPVDVLGDAPAHGRQSVFEPISLGDDHLEHLTPETVANAKPRQWSRSSRCRLEGAASRPRTLSALAARGGCTPGEKSLGSQCGVPSPFRLAFGLRPARRG